APRSSGDDAVVGSLLGTGPGQTNVNRHSRFLTSGASRNEMPLGSRPSYPPEGPLSRQAAGDRAEKNLQVLVREAQPGPDEEVAAHAKAARDRVPPRPGEGVVEPDGQVEVRNDREVGVGANAGEARLGPRKVEGVQREGEAVVEEVEVEAEAPGRFDQAEADGQKRIAFGQLDRELEDVRGGPDLLVGRLVLSGRAAQHRLPPHDAQRIVHDLEEEKLV